MSKNVTIVISDCPMWKKLEVGTILRMPDVQANEAVFNAWAEETPDKKMLLRGERVRLRKEIQ